MLAASRQQRASRLNEADRIAKGQVRARQREAAAAKKLATEREEAAARAELDEIRTLSREVVALLAERGYRDPEPEALRLAVYLS